MLTSLQTALPYLLGILVLYLTSEAIQNKSRILCTYRTKARTKLHKWAKKSKRGGWNDVVFEGCLYHVEPDRIVMEWKTYLGFFPLPVMGLDFRHDSARALHPDTFDNTFTPDQREELNISDDIRQFAEGNQSSIGSKTKKGMLESFMPIIMIIGFLAIGYLVFNMQKNINLLGQGQNFMEQQIGVIKQMVGGK